MYGIYVNMQTASGRAKCGYCKGRIKKGVKCFVVGEYKSEIRLHINHRECERYMMLRKLVDDESMKLGKEIHDAYQSTQVRAHFDIKDLRI
jgi:hypothetical protein